MRLAAEHKDNYIILSVTYDYRQKQVRGVNVYIDPCLQLANGTLVNEADGYWFRERLKAGQL